MRKWIESLTKCVALSKFSCLICEKNFENIDNSITLLKQVFFSLPGHVTCFSRGERGDIYIYIYIYIYI